jgi:hypothetical protein
VSAALLLVLAAAAAPGGSVLADPDVPLLSHPYGVLAAPSFPGGLFHWIDSLAGTSVGKTVPAHQEDFVRRFGPPTAEDRKHIYDFVTARSEHLKRAREIADREGAPVRSSAMLGVFCSAPTVEDALETIRPELPPEAWRGLRDALAWFRPRYETIWDGGSVPRAFLERARADARLGSLETILGRVVAFYGVDPTRAQPPRLALVPVPPGYGTHAEAIGGVLLLEIRPGESLSDEASVIVHENAHWLWGLVPKERQARLTAYAEGLDERSRRAFTYFGEAIPTALGQGVADSAFRPGVWSIDGPWYHTVEVDAYAKRIYPLVRYALDSGSPLDEAFLRKALDLVEGGRKPRARIGAVSP